MTTKPKTTTDQTQESIVMSKILSLLEKMNRRMDEESISQHTQRDTSQFSSHIESSQAPAFTPLEPHNLQSVAKTERPTTYSTPSKPRQEECSITLGGLSLVGISSPRTMKFLGWIKGKEVVVMVVTGATHNFLSDELVTSLELPLSSTESYGVKMVAGGTVQGEGVCKDVELKLKGLVVRADFLPMELGHADVILGIQWLNTLGEVMMNWKLLKMEFMVGKDMVCLQGDPEGCERLWSKRKTRESFSNKGH